MQVSIMTSSFSTCRDREGISTYNECVRRLKAIGVDHIDINLTSIDCEWNMFHADDWEQKAHALREEADKLGVTFIQSHLPYNDRRTFKPYPPEYEEHFREMLRRGQKISEICGVPNMVVHPLSDGDARMDDIHAHAQYNCEFHDELLTASEKAGMYVCFENIPLGYGQTAAQLLELMEAGKGRNMAVCWDFGHAELIYPQRAWHNAYQSDAIRALKGYIRAVHVHDNFGKNDDHMLPFLGVVKWEEVIPALKDAGYTGDLVFEAKFIPRMPYDLMDESAEFMKKVGNKLIELFESGNRL